MCKSQTLTSTQAICLYVAVFLIAGCAQQKNCLVSVHDSTQRHSEQTSTPVASRPEARHSPSELAGTHDVKEDIEVESVSVIPTGYLEEADATPSESSVSMHPMNSATLERPMMSINLPMALSQVGGTNPAVGFANWRVQEAYARQERANVLWLPSIQAGLSFHRHDGNLQNSNGGIQDVNRNSFQYGLGAGAVGAGTTPRPGLVAQFHMIDAIFQPEIAQRNTWAAQHAASAAFNRQLLEASLAYLELLSAEQDQAIVITTYSQTQELAKLTKDFAEAGQGLQSDADRMQTESILVEDRVLQAQERCEMASSRLSAALSLRTGARLVPAESNVVPIELVTLDGNQAAMISTGLSHRPELKEAGCLVSAACEEYKRQKYAPFVPSVLLGASQTGFGGGLGNSLGEIDNRVDLDAVMTWEIRNMGFGEKAARAETSARIEQAKYQHLRQMDVVAREVSEAHSQLMIRQQRLTIAEEAIRSAENSYARNLNRIRDGQGLPIEVLQAIQALETARRNYLESVMSHNEAQFRLQWALGWPVTAVSL